MYSFPNNVSGCYNDSQCVSGTCSVTYDSGKNYWCNCKAYYNPLDGCRTNYYETLDPIISWTLFSLTVILDIICVSLLATRFKYEIYKWYSLREKTLIPRSKLVTMSINIICCIVDIVAACFTKAGITRASILMNGLASSIFIQAFFSTIYYLFIIVVKSNKLGNIEGLLKGLSLTIAIVGPIGLTITWITGFIRDLTDHPPKTVALLTMIISVFLILTLLIVLSISIPSIIIMLMKFNNINRIKSPTIRLLWRCSWIVISMAGYTIISLIILILLSYSLPEQLFSSITIYRVVSQVLYIGGRFLYASFFLSIKIPKNIERNSDISTNKSSHTAVVNVTPNNLQNFEKTTTTTLGSADTTSKPKDDE